MKFSNERGKIRRIVWGFFLMSIAWGSLEARGGSGEWARMAAEIGGWEHSMEGPEMFRAGIILREKAGYLFDGWGFPEKRVFPGERASMADYAELTPFIFGPDFGPSIAQENPQSISIFFWLFVVSSAVWFLSWLGITVQAFRTSPGWGLFCFFGIIIAGYLFYLVAHFEDNKVFAGIMAISHVVSLLAFTAMIVIFIPTPA